MQNGVTKYHEKVIVWLYDVAVPSLVAPILGFKEHFRKSIIGLH